MKPNALFTMFLMAIALFLGPIPGEAHFIWVEVDPKAAAGGAQEIQVYFGEPHEFLREESGGRLDQHDGLQAWVIDPKGKKVELQLEKGLNRFVGTFVPKTVGRHNVVVTSQHHEVMDLIQYDRGVVKPHFYARAQFLAFEKGRISEREEEIVEFLGLDIVPVTKALDPLKGSIVANAGAEIVVRAVFKGQPLAKRRVNAFGPNGWLKELQSTDSLGMTSFVPLWPGRYVLVLMNDEKAPAEFNGKRYDALNHRASLSILVGKND